MGPLTPVRVHPLLERVPVELKRVEAERADLQPETMQVARKQLEEKAARAGVRNPMRTRSSFRRAYPSFLCLPITVA